MKKGSILIFLLTIIILCIGIFYIHYENYRLHIKIQKLNNHSDILQTENENYLRKIETLEAKMAFREESGTYNVEKLKSLDLEGYDFLMISTHPDDEMFWGGGELLKENYLVVCVTCGMDDNRRLEFEKTMQDTNDKYIMLKYPASVDVNLNREFNSEATSYLTQDIINILSLKDWNKIVTHNPDGEYGHKYHILTSQVVTASVKNKDTLYYFGRHYSKNEIAQYDETLDKETLEKKLNIIQNNYKSQYGSVNIHKHMFGYEQFIKYSDWK